MIKIKNISKTYLTNLNFFNLKNHKTKTIKVLKDVSLDINPSDIISINGKNGSGKTTLLRIIGQILTPDNGAILFEDKKITQKNLKARISLCSTNDRALFLRLTLMQNIEFFLGLHGLRTYDLNNKINLLLEKFNLELYKDVYVWQLSSGQKKLVMIMISLLRDVQLYLFDEAYANLDSINRRILKDFILDFNKSKSAIIWISHEENDGINKIANKKYYLDSGHLNEKS